MLASLPFFRFSHLLRAAMVTVVSLATVLPGTAQLLPAGAYTVVASSGTYSPLTYTNANVRDIQQDDNNSRTYPIGFPFLFEGQTYTNFVVSSEGYLTFNQNAGNVVTNDLASSFAPRPMLAVFWDDLSGSYINAFAGYLTDGTAPNRVLTMEWRNWRWPSNSFGPGVPSPPGNNISFQVKIFETTGVIQYIYRQEADVPNPTTALSATIGLAGYNSFLSLSDASAAPTASNSVSTNTITQRPATGQVYTFTPPAPCPNPTGLTAVGTGTSTATVSFVPGAGNTSYVVTYGKQLVGAPSIPPLTVSGSPVLLTGLDPNSTYYVSVASTCANGASSPGITPAVYFFTQPPLNSISTWTGAVSTAWNEPGNWSSGLVPVATTNVTIPAVANQPIVTGAQTCGNIILRLNATLTLAPATAPGTPTRLTASGNVSWPPTSTLVQGANTTLAVGGNWTNNGGTFTLAPTSTVAFEGGGTHALNGPEPTPLQNLVVGAVGTVDELNLDAPVSVQRLLTSMENSFTQVTTSGSLRLLDNAQGTAQVVSGTNAFIAGPVTVEKALPAGTGRYYYSPSVRGATLAGLAAPSFAPVVNAAYNTSPTPSTVAPFPNVFGYDQSRVSTNAAALDDFESGFFSPAALTEILTPGLGFRLDVPAPTTLGLTGPLSSSNATRNALTRATLPQSGYHLLGNPYPAALDWDAVATATGTTGLDAAVYVPQPNGTFQPYVNGVGASRYVMPGQAFFVRVSAASTPANVAINQAARYPAYFDRANPPATTPETRPLVQLTLSGAAGPTDDATAYFQTGATAQFDRLLDAGKLPTSGVPYVAFTGSQPLAINGLPPLGTADVTLPLDVHVPATGSYTLQATRRLNLPAGTYIYLRDAQTGAAIDLALQPVYTFTMNAAFSGTRFSLVFTRTQLLSVAPAALSRQVLVYPNPAHSNAMIELPASLQQQPLTATLVNMLGQTTRSVTLPATTASRAVSLAGLAPGVYSLQLHTAQGTIIKQLVVE